MIGCLLEVGADEASWSMAPAISLKRGQGQPVSVTMIRNLDIGEDPINILTPVHPSIVHSSFVYVGGEALGIPAHARLWPFDMSMLEVRE